LKNIFLVIRKIEKGAFKMPLFFVNKDGKGCVFCKKTLKKNEGDDIAEVKE
jgi:hypothetical protein